MATPTLSASRLTRIKKSGQVCGECGRVLEVGEVVAWNSFSSVTDKYQSKWRCVESADSGSCWGDKYSASDIQAKKSGIVAEPVVSGTSGVAADGSGVSAVVPAESVAVPVNGNGHGPMVVESARSVPSNGSGRSESSAFGVLADALAPYIEERIRTKVDEDTVLSLLEDGLTKATADIKADVTDWIRENMTVTVTVVDSATGQTFGMGVQHHQFPTLLQACSARTSDGHRLNIWLKGPAGSGKTTAAKEVARALNLPFYFCGSLSEPYGLLGFTDASGKVVRTQFREAYEHGGVFLFDEIDGSDPAAVLPFNAALANGRCAFPDGVIERHPNTVIIAAANTFGLGATDAYVGRLKLDGASLDRFCWLDWDVDEKLESATCPDTEWVRKVQTVRANVKRLGIKVLVTPRASYKGAALLASGLPMDVVERMALRGAMTTDQWEQVKA